MRTLKQIEHLFDLRGYFTALNDLYEVNLFRDLDAFQVTIILRDEPISGTRYTDVELIIEADGVFKFDSSNAVATELVSDDPADFVPVIAEDPHRHYDADLAKEVMDYIKHLVEMLK